MLDARASMAGTGREMGSDCEAGLPVSRRRGRLKICAAMVKEKGGLPTAGTRIRFAEVEWAEVTTMAGKCGPDGLQLALGAFPEMRECPKVRQKAAVGIVERSASMSVLIALVRSLSMTAMAFLGLFRRPAAPLMVCSETGFPG
jgi:hypothetical protein